MTHALHSVSFLVVSDFADADCWLQSSIVSSVVAANYPQLDKTPPTDSDEVQQWIQEVTNTGVV